LHWQILSLFVIEYSLVNIKFLVIFQEFKLFKRLQEKKSIAVRLHNMKSKQKKKEIEEFVENYKKKLVFIYIWKVRVQIKISKELGTKWENVQSTW
jgi:transposase